MAVLSRRTKGRLAIKAAGGAAKRPGVVAALGRTGVGVGKVGARSAPPLARATLRVGRPIVKRRARRRLSAAADTTGAAIAQTAGAVAAFVETAGEILAAYGPPAAQALGLCEPPRQRRTAPRVALGVLIGAGAMYLLEPGQGAEHRRQLLRLVR